MSTYIQMYKTASATAMTDLGIFSMAIRNDSGSTQLVSANQTFGGFGINASGWLWVTGNVNATVGTIAVSAVTAFVSGSFAENSPHTDADRGVFLLGLRNDSGATQHASADGNYVGPSFNASGWMWVTGAVNVSATNVVTVSANNTVTVSASNVVTVSANNTLTVAAHAVTAAQSGSWAVSTNATAIAGNAIATSTGTSNSGTQRVVLASDQTTVNVSATNVVSVSATNAINVNVTGVLNPILIEGEVAHDAAASTVNPVVIGAVATAFGTATADVTLGDNTRVFATRGGSLFVLGGAPQTDTAFWEVTAANTNVMLIASAANQKIAVTEAGFYVGASVSVSETIRVGFGASTLPATSTAVGGVTGMLIDASAAPANSGYIRGGGMGVIGVSLDSQGIVMTNTVPTGGRVKVWMTYFKVAS